MSVIDEIVTWLHGLEEMRMNVASSGTDMAEVAIMRARRGVYEGIADDIKRKWGARVLDSVCTPRATTNEVQQEHGHNARGVSLEGRQGGEDRDPVAAEAERDGRPRADVVLAPGVDDERRAPGVPRSAVAPERCPSDASPSVEDSPLRRLLRGESTPQEARGWDAVTSGHNPDCPGIYPEEAGLCTCPPIEIRSNDAPVGFNHQCGAIEGRDRCFTTANRWFVVTTDGMHLALCDMHADRERERKILQVEERVAPRVDKAHPNDWDVPAIESHCAKCERCQVYKKMADDEAVRHATRANKAEAHPCSDTPKGEVSKIESKP